MIEKCSTDIKLRPYFLLKKLCKISEETVCKDDKHMKSPFDMFSFVNLQLNESRSSVTFTQGG